MPQAAETVVTIDCHYIREQVAAAYLIIEDGRAAFVENNTVHAVPYLLTELEKHGLSGKQVDFLMVTHVHLDHSGGTAELLKHCPNATVLAQERAAPHIVDPTRLVKGAQGVYGKERFAELYGDIEPVDKDRVRVVADGETISFGSRKLTFFYTLGHAKHHMCVYDSGSNGVFSGDSFGLAYPQLRRDDRFFIFPSTTPADFDPVEARIALDKIMATGADRIYLTHFGVLHEVDEGFRKMVAALNYMQGVLDKVANPDMADEEIDGFCLKEVEFFFRRELADLNLPSFEEVAKLLSGDMHLNAMGIAHSARKLRRK